MKYTIIIPFRDRQQHLEILVPKLRDWFIGQEYKIVVAEQADAKKFRKSSLLNIAVNYTKNGEASADDILIFHDVDYYSETDIVNPYLKTNITGAYLPVKRVEFVDENLLPLEQDRIPSGYRHFRESVDENFFGGVVIMPRTIFEAINGFNPLYIGWGLEDADIRSRLLNVGFTYERHPNALFFALPHADSNPGIEDADFQANNVAFHHSAALQRRYGYSNVQAKVEETESVLADTWLKISDFEIINV